jgi:hypothetical protein
MLQHFLIYFDLFDYFIIIVPCIDDRLSWVTLFFRPEQDKDNSYFPFFRLIWSEVNWQTVAVQVQSGKFLTRGAQDFNNHISLKLK